jgi:hypothetical protein
MTRDLALVIPQGSVDVQHANAKEIEEAIAKGITLNTSSEVKKADEPSHSCQSCRREYA